MSNLLIKNILVYTPEHRFVPGEILVRDGSIRRISLQEEASSQLEDEASSPLEDGACEEFDGHGAYCFPGMVDIHFHGCMGADVCDGTLEAVQTIAEYEASIGVTAICPATMTLPEADLTRALSVMAEYRRGQLAGEYRGAALVGINMEGPFISPVKKGAQDDRNIVPADTALFDRFWGASDGLIAFMGLAPEENTPETVSAFIAHVKEKGSRVSLCHTNASYAAAKQAIEAGACHAIHLYNAMPEMTHRDPGVVGAVFDSPDVDAELLCDGVHNHPAVVRATFAMLGEERIVLISDTMRAAGIGDGSYTLGGLDVTVTGKYAIKTGDPQRTIMGSVTTLPDMVRNAVREMQIPLETAIRCATENAAKSIGLSDRYGVLAEGRQADLVLWDTDLKTIGVMQKGSWLEREEE